MPKQKTQIVVVGGGAGGLELVRKLGARYGRKDHDIILVDRNRTHVWKPLLHEVAAGSLDANLDEVGYGGHAARWGYRFFYGTLESIDREARTHHHRAARRPGRGGGARAGTASATTTSCSPSGACRTTSGCRASGSTRCSSNSGAQADTFRHKLLNACFRANLESAKGEPDAKVRICIVGGGATGVELAAELFNAAKGSAELRARGVRRAGARR